MTSNAATVAREITIAIHAWGRERRV